MSIENIGLQKIVLDISKKLTQKTFYANEVDANGRGFHAFLKNNGVTVDGTGVTLRFRYTSLNDGQSKTFDFEHLGEHTNGEFEIHYPTEMIRGFGGRLFKCTIVASDATSDVAFENIYVYVNKAEVNTEGIEASNEFSTLKVALDNVANLETTYAPRLNDAEAAINNIPNQDYITNKALRTDMDAIETSLVQIARNVKHFGAKGDGVTDDTAAIQSAINTGAGTILIPDGTYMINGNYGNNSDGYGGISMGSNQKLLLSPNAVLKCITNVIPSYAVVRMDGCINSSIEGGTVEGERLTHVGTTGEWGIGIYVRGSKHVTIKDVTTKNCWGDGIGVTSLNGVQSEYITIENVASDNNRRQGLTNGEASHVKISNSTFSNTNGTMPQSGIDIEPNNGAVRDIQIINCKLVGNAGSGIEALYCKDVNISSCHIEGNKQGVLVMGDVNRESQVSINNNVFVDNVSSNIQPKDYSDVEINNNKIGTTVTVGIGSILFDGIPNRRIVSIKNNRFNTNGKQHIFWNAAEAITRLIIEGNTFVGRAAAYCEKYYGNIISFKGNVYILESDYVATNAFSSHAVYFMYAVRPNNCSFYNYSANSVKAMNPDKALPKNCLFTNNFNFTTVDGLSTIREFYQGDFVESYDTTKLPDSFGVGESISLVNGDANLPSVQKQGILRTVKVSNSTSYRKFIIQFYYPANNDATTLNDVYFRKGVAASDTWSTFKKVTAIN